MNSTADWLYFHVWNCLYAVLIGYIIFFTSENKPYRFLQTSFTQWNSHDTYNKYIHTYIHTSNAAVTTSAMNHCPQANSMPYINCGPAWVHITRTFGIWVPRNSAENTMLIRKPARSYLHNKPRLRHLETKYYKRIKEWILCFQKTNLICISCILKHFVTQVNKIFNIKTEKNIFFETRI